jgi:probable selenium-dependent hydroxylase accessory protein YqeC
VYWKPYAAIFSARGKKEVIFMKIMEALSLSDRGGVVSFAGGGGKTSLMFRLNSEIPVKYRVILTTTTKIYMPPADKYPTLLVSKKSSANKILQNILQSGIRPVLGLQLLQDNKVKGFSAERLDRFINENNGFTDFVLVEADGSKGRSLKGYLDCEPVIPRFTTVMVVVIGADAIGSVFDANVAHRPEVVSRMIGLKPGSIVDPEDIARLIIHPQGVLRSCPPGARIVPFINKADCLKNRDEAYKLARFLLGGRIRSVIIGSAISKNPVIDVVE